LRIFISEVCITLVALRMNLYQEVALSFKKVWDPCTKESRLIFRASSRPTSLSPCIHRYPFTTKCLCFLSQTGFH